MLEVMLRDGEVAIIDDEDAWVLQHKWYLNRTSEGSAYVRCRKIGYLHRLILNPPKYKVVDHVNGDTLDNRRSNIRVVSAKHNSANRPRNLRSTSGYKGVVRSKTGAFTAQLKTDRKMIYIGRFVSASHAAMAYDFKAIEVWGEFAYTNFPRDILSLINPSLLVRSLPGGRKKS